MTSRLVRALRVLTALLACRAALPPATTAVARVQNAPTPAATVADTDGAKADAAAALQRARKDAELRHTQALGACAATPNPAACRQNEAANHQHILRALAADEQRIGAPPPASAQDAQRIEGERLIRELERSMPKARPPPLGPVPDRPGMGRPFGR